MAKEIYRKVVLERLASPEQLDQLVKLTTPMGWLALTAMSLIVGAVTLWGFFGNASYQVGGQAVFLNSSGEYRLYAPTDGKIIESQLVTGQELQEGNLLAIIAPPVLIRQIAGIEGEYRAALDAGDLAKSNQLASRLAELRTRLDTVSHVLCRQGGVVTAVTRQAGDLVKEGELLATVEIPGKDIRELEVMLYIPVDAGKKVQPGMAVRLMPSVVNREEYGYMLGKVTEVAELPSSPDEMMKVLNNQEFIRLLTKNGPVVAIKVDLEQDFNTVSAYKWSSREGPSVKISGGTLGSGLISVKTVKPISMVIPIIK